MYSLQIVSCCDGETFKRFALPFVASINAHSPGQKINIHVVNPPSDFNERIAKLQRYTRAVALKFTTEFNTSNLSTAENIKECTIRKLKNHLLKTWGDTLFLDITTVVKKDLLIFFNYLHAVSLAFAPQKDNTSFPSIVWLHNCWNTVRFLSFIQKTAAHHQNFVEQLHLYKRINVVKLADLFVSSCFFEDSILWDRRNAKRSIPEQKEATKYIHTLCQKFIAKKTVAILMRRVELPFKAWVMPSRKKTLRRIHDKTRLHWQYFPKLLRDAYALQTEMAEIICMPKTKLTKAFITTLPHRIIYMPHGNYKQFADQRLHFYMQEIYPFFFTVDKQGWGATSSQYGQQDYLNVENYAQAEDFCDSIKNRKITKYRQESAPIPAFDVFFPLQIPDDESIIFGSQHSLRKIVHAVVEWANTYKIHVLFKCHPIKPSIGYLRVNNKSPYAQFTKTGDIHELISKAKIVFVANSGVGFESLLYFKPLVHFARAIYDVVAVKSEPEVTAIQKAYLFALQQEDLKSRYLKFIQWYLFDIGTLINTSPCTIALTHQKTTVIGSEYYKEIESYKGLDCYSKLLQSSQKKYVTWGLRVLQGIKKLIKF